MLHSVSGCDSVINLQLTVDSINASITESSLDSLIILTNGAIQWINCTTGLAVTGISDNVLLSDTGGSFAAVVTVGGCTDTTPCIQMVALGVKNLPGNSINIYPNPTDGNLIIQANGLHPDWITIYNTNGQKVSEMKFAPVIDISGLASGVYFVEVRAGENVYRSKVVKM